MDSIFYLFIYFLHRASRKADEMQNVCGEISSVSQGTCDQNAGKVTFNDNHDHQTGAFLKKKKFPAEMQSGR